MNQSFAPTKGGFMAAKRNLELAKTGFELIDKKRSILTMEMMELAESVKEIRQEIAENYKKAYLALQQANITLGFAVNEDVARAVPIENGVSLSFRSVMGVQLPSASIKSLDTDLHYGIDKTNSQLDLAYIYFNRVKELTIKLAVTDSCVCRLAKAIKKASKRTNALKNVVIPSLEETVKSISNMLEEKEREEFGRLKVIKRHKEK